MRRVARCRDEAWARSLFRNKWVTAFRFFLKASLVAADGCFFSKRSALHFPLIADSIAGVTNGFFGLRFLTTLEGTSLSTTDENVDSHDFQAPLISSAVCTPDQSAVQRLLLMTPKSALSKLQTLLLGPVWRREGEVQSWQRTNKWSERPRGGWVDTLDTRLGSETKTRSSSEPKLPSLEMCVGSWTH